MAEDTAAAETARVADPPAEDVKEEEDWKVQAEAFKTEGESWLPLSKGKLAVALLVSLGLENDARLPCRLGSC